MKARKREGAKYVYELEGDMQGLSESGEEWRHYEGSDTRVVARKGV